MGRKQNTHNPLRRLFLIIVSVFPADVQAPMKNCQKCEFKYNGDEYVAYAGNPQKMKPYALSDRMNEANIPHILTWLEGTNVRFINEGMDDELEMKAMDALIEYGHLPFKINI